MEPTLVCPNCHAENLPGALTCYRCNAKLINAPGWVGPMAFKTYDASKDLGLVTEVIPVLQEYITALLDPLEDAWTEELENLHLVDYLSQAVANIPKVPLRLVAIEYIFNNTAIRFSFDFNLKGTGVLVQGISILSFGVSFSVAGSRFPGTGKKNWKSKKTVIENFLQLKKAS